MKIKVKARPNAFEKKVEKLADGSLVISVKEPPIKGQANRAIIRALADYFRVDQSRIRLVSGYSSAEKLFEITVNP